ncbi:hypothetical protein VMCG_04364 [Cytospora schulzeri]|uniref:ER-bound oxygenase mpaB/mpaB'/Rubber oxygenase catalytic domain-containing protein n=1 Tax=Cytospora schulzeri TaxID=448051 RepID=A0A423WSX8_9PEZI|nr:hypothetical protein VMCG_04364 [Valsa malicola]
MFFFKDTRDMRHSWGYTFEWTPEHQTKEQMRHLTYTYDILGAECLDRLDEISPPGSSNPRPPGTQEGPDNSPHSQEEKSPQPHRDLYLLLEQHHATDPKLNELWTEIHNIPEWVDWAQIKRGQDVFYRYGGPAIVSLTFQSLVGGMGGRRVVETLARTGGFGVKVAKRRLLETFQHILQVTKDLDSIQPGGEGFASSVKVRLLHASVRRRILALEGARPGYFDVGQWGVPINDLDCMGTVLTFSAALVWLGLPRQGIYLREHEIVDYTALWRWVGHLLGTPTRPWLADHRRARVLFESLIEADIDPGDMSGVLANNVLTGLSCLPPAHASREFLCAEAHWLNGRELSDALGIQRPSLWHSALVAGQCLYFMAVCYLYRSIPSWDEQKIEMTIHNKTLGLGTATNFEFQYVPQLGQTTTEPSGPKDLGLRTGPAPHPAAVAVAGAERRGLATLVLAAALVGSVAWLGSGSASALLAAVRVVS